ncbi:MAG: hypothetical protein JXP48_13170 [Acidobacteria bacterium]|nr:hypothetical protein [Acidobacteriota bacterium]
MAIGRLFVEIGKDVDRLNASLRESMKAAEEAGVKVTASGQRMLAAFDRALNPTKELGEQIQLLEKAGKSSSDIWKVYEDRVKQASEAQQRMGGAIDPTVQRLMEQNKQVARGMLNFENLGKSIQEFAANPVEAAKAGVTSILERLGPVAIGMGAVAAAAGLAGKALFDMGADMANRAEELYNLKISTGLTTQSIQALVQISKEAGLEGIDLARTIGELNKQLGSREGGDFTRALVAHNIALIDANGNAKNAVALLDELRGKFAGIVDPIERAQAMNAALGGRLRTLIPLLMSSNESLAEQIKIMESSGPVWDEITQQKLMQFDEALDKVDRAWARWVTNKKVGVGETLSYMAKLGEAANNNPFFKFIIEGSKDYTLWDAPGFRAPEDEQGAWQHVQRDKNFQNVVRPPTPPSGEMQYNPAEQARAIFVEQQKLIAQGADQLDLRMKISEAQKTFDNLIAKGTNEQLASQAAVLRGLNAQLKAVGELAKAQDQLTAKKQEMQEIFNASYWGSFEGVDSLPQPMDLNVQETSRRLGAQNLNSFNAELEAVLEKYRTISISTDQFAESWDAIGKAALEATEVDVAILGEAEDRITRMLERSKEYTATPQEEQLEIISQHYAEIEELREKDLISEEEYSNAKKRLAAEESIAKLSNARTFFGDLAELQSSHIRAIAAIGKAAAIAQATINTYEGATKALAQGGIWGAINMAAVMAAGFAQVAAISSQGFKEGGFTGFGSPDEVAGFVHGQEFVMDADVTRRYRPLLEALQNDTVPQGSAYDSGSPIHAGALMRPPLQVSVYNYGTSKSFDVEMLDAGTMRIIARDEALSVLTQRGPEVIAADLAYANSRTSKALAQHTTARRGDR